MRINPLSNSNQSFKGTLVIPVAKKNPLEKTHVVYTTADNVAFHLYKGDKESDPLGLSARLKVGSDVYLFSDDKARAARFQFHKALNCSDSYELDMPEATLLEAPL